MVSQTAAISDPAGGRLSPVQTSLMEGLAVAVGVPVASSRAAMMATMAVRRVGLILRSFPGFESVFQSRIFPPIALGGDQGTPGRAQRSVASRDELSGSRTARGHLCDPRTLQRRRDAVGPVRSQDAGELGQDRLFVGVGSDTDPCRQGGNASSQHLVA